MLQCTCECTRTLYVVSSKSSLNFAAAIASGSTGWIMTNLSIIFFFFYVVEGAYYGSEPHEPALELLQLLRYIDYWQSGIATPSNHTSNIHILFIVYICSCSCSSLFLCSCSFFVYDAHMSLFMFVYTFMLVYMFVYIFVYRSCAMCINVHVHVQYIVTRLYNVNVQCSNCSWTSCTYSCIRYCICSCP